MSPVKENRIEQGNRSYLDFFWRHICFYLLLAVLFLFLCNIRGTTRVDAVDYAAVGSHLYYNHNWLPTTDGGYSRYANEGYEFLHCFTTFALGNAPLSRGSAISFVAFMLGSVYYVKCLRYFFTLRESQLILLLQLPLLDVIVLPLTDSVAWCFYVVLMWVFMKRGFRASFVFGLILGAGFLCRNQILVIFLPLPILMGTLSTWKKDWRALSWDLCRCAAGFVVSITLFEILVLLWVENHAATGNFYTDYYASHVVGAQSRVWMFLRYCKHIFCLRFDVYGGIMSTVLLSVVFCPTNKFAWRFAWFILFSFAATFFSYALLVYARGDSAVGQFPLRYLIYYYSSIVPFLYYFATIVVRRIKRRNLIPLPSRITGSRAYTVSLTIVMIILFSQPLDIPLFLKSYLIGRSVVQFVKHPGNGLSCVNLYRNERALSKELCRMPSSEASLCVFFDRASIGWYKALYPVSSYDTDTLVTYRGVSLEQRSEAVENFFDDHELSKFSRIILLVDKVYLDGIKDEADKTMFDKFLSDEEFSKAFDRKEYDCKKCVFFVFTRSQQ